MKLDGLVLEVLVDCWIRKGWELKEEEDREEVGSCSDPEEEGSFDSAVVAVAVDEGRRVDRTSVGCVDRRWAAAAAAEEELRTGSVG